MSLSRTRLGSAVFNAIMMLAGSAGASVVTITPALDNTLYEDPLGLISNGQGEYMFVGETAQANSRRGVLSFNVAGSIPAGSTINSVSLQMNCSRSTTSSRTINLHRLNASWGEGNSNAGEPGGNGAPPETGDATWLHRFYPDVLWTNPGGDFAGAISSSTSVGGAGLYTWPTSSTMVADVQAWLNSPAQNFGWLLRGPENGSTSAKRLDTSENINPALRPQLTIDYTPVPEPASLMGILVLGALSLRRR